MICLGEIGVWNVDFWIFIGNIGSLLFYLIGIGSTASSLLTSWGCQDNGGCGLTDVTALFAAVVILPVCCLRVYGHLAIVSAFSMFAIFAIFVMVLAGATSVAYSDDVETIYIKGGALSQVGGVIFALTCSFGSMQTFTAMAAPTKENWRFCAGVASFIAFILLFCIGITGYYAFGHGTKSFILNNFTDHWADFFKLLFIIHMCMYIPVDFITMREHFLKALFLKKTGVLDSTVLNFITSFGLLFGKSRRPIYLMVVIEGVLLSCLAATAGVLGLYQEGLNAGQAYNVTLNLTGAIACSMTSFVIPAAMYFRLVAKPESLKTPWFWLIVVMCCIGLGVAISVPYYTVKQYEFVKSDDPNSIDDDYTRAIVYPFRRY